MISCQGQETLTMLLRALYMSLGLMLCIILNENNCVAGYAGSYRQQSVTPRNFE